MDALAEALSARPRAYALGSVPEKPEYPYDVYAGSLGRGDSYTLDSREGVRWGRIIVQSFGRTADSATTSAEAVRELLVGASLPVAGRRTTPTRSELDPALVRDADDGGVISVTATYIFTATKE